MTDQPAPNKQTESLSFLEQNILEKADIKVTAVNELAFQKASSNEDAYSNITALCEKSKGYQSNAWEGLNDCSWAAEQERIASFEHINRQEDRLLIKKAEGTLEIEHSFFDNQPTRYAQFGGYLSANNYYIIEQLQANHCIQTKLIPHEGEQEYLLKGRMLVYGKEDQFYLLSHQLDKHANCLNKIAHYSWTTEGLTKSWEIPLKNRKITEANVNDDGTIYLSLSYLEKNIRQTTYLKVN